MPVGMCGMTGSMCVSSIDGMSSMCGPPVNVSKGSPASMGATGGGAMGGGGGGGGGGGTNGLPRHAASAGIVAHTGSFGPVGRGGAAGGAGGGPGAAGVA